MHSFIASASLIGLSCLSVVSAAPFSFGNNPLGNGFPTVATGSEQLKAIEAAAHGSLPNGPPPPSAPSSDSITSLRLIAFNELFEVAYFTSLKNNITNNVDGYTFHTDHEKQHILDILTNIQAQEELHELNANGAVAKFGTSGPVQPCQYNFPVTNFKDAIALASKFTDVVLGTLQDVQNRFGTAGDIGLIRGVGSVIGQEGEQNGFFRLKEELLPSALPFLTTSTREFAFSALNQNFVVSGTCPNIDTIDIPIFEPLTIETQDIDAKVQPITFSFTIPKTVPSSWHSDYTGLSLVYINQQNTPVVEQLENIQIDLKNLKVTFTVNFPFDAASFGNGLTIAAVTNSTGPFTSADAVADATVFGPALIEIN